MSTSPTRGGGLLQQLARPDPAQRALRRLLPRAVTLWRQTDWRLALVETVALMALALGLSAWLRPADPLWINAGFPWMWLMVALTALRYGSLHGVLAMAMALGTWLVIDATPPGLGEFPRASFLGGLVLALVAGAFCDRWVAQITQAQAVNAYLDERLHVLTQHHFVLNASHDRLEQELLTRPFTLRETLMTLRQLLRPPYGDGGTLPAADALLQLLARTCRIESAALFAIQAQRITERPVAALGGFGIDPRAESGSGDLRGEFGGGAGPLDHADPMLLAALESGQLMHVQSEPFVDAERPSRYVICAPLVSSDGATHGVLAVERIAFTALTLENLQFMTVLLAYYGDSIDPDQRSAPLLAAYPRCPPEFAIELARAARLLQTSFLRSSLAVFTLPADATRATEVAARLQRLGRNVDVSWQHTEEGARMLVVLLPLTAAAGLASYAERIASEWRTQTGNDLAQDDVRFLAAELDVGDAVPQVRALLERARA